MTFMRSAGRTRKLGIRAQTSISCRLPHSPRRLVCSPAGKDREESALLLSVRRSPPRTARGISRSLESYGPANFGRFWRLAKRPRPARISQSPLLMTPFFTPPAHVISSNLQNCHPERRRRSQSERLRSRRTLCCWFSRKSVREFSPCLTFHLFRFRFSVYSV
jgi:hypothetical protein